jgi:hypothetical protein
MSLWKLQLHYFNLVHSRAAAGNLKMRQDSLGENLCRLKEIPKH